ncbi:MAG: hypothetical protein I8H68_10105 [Flavobacteriia bacterium]|nr:hypothetical protein [Flavobacteriia bacterium]MBH2024982.1 hypothetical protein [Flavobacteriales bacterium]
MRYILLLYIVMSCQQLHVKPVEDLKNIEFSEINHVNVKLTESESEILDSQKSIDRIYNTINMNNPSPRKNPIPSFTETEMYILVQPKIEKSDFTVTGVSGGGNTLKITVQPYDNREYTGRSNPASVIVISKNHQFKTIEIQKIKP